MLGNISHKNAPPVAASRCSFCVISPPLFWVQTLITKLVSTYILITTLPTKNTEMNTKSNKSVMNKLT